VDIRDGEVPVFWAYGVTPQAAVTASRPPLAICHAPGHMAVTDARDTDLVTPRGPDTAKGRRNPATPVTC
jgi:hypothetical protein